MFEAVKKIIPGLFFICVLSGCSFFSPLKTEPVKLYVLNTTPQTTINKFSQPITLYVAPIESNPIYSTSSMAYSMRPYEINYFAKNRWATPPEKMLHPMIVDTLQKTRYFSSVSASPTGQYDLMLTMQLVKLEQQFSLDSSFLQLGLRAKLINIATNQVVATKEFSMIETAPSNTPYGGVIAANLATSRLLAAITSFCIQGAKKFKNNGAITTSKKCIK